MEAKQFGLYIKKLRTERKMTIRQLELYSGVSNSYLSQVENGKRGIPSPEIIKKLSKGLKVDYNEMMINAGYVDETDVDLMTDEEIDEELKEAQKELTVWYKNEPKDKRLKLRMLRQMIKTFEDDE